LQDFGATLLEACLRNSEHSTFGTVCRTILTAADHLGRWGTGSNYKHHCANAKFYVAYRQQNFLGPIQFKGWLQQTLPPRKELRILEQSAYCSA